MKRTNTLKGRKVDPKVVKRRVATRKKNSEFWHSEETIEKIREAAIGQVKTQETKDKIAKSMEGHIPSLESVAKGVWSRRIRKEKEKKEEEERFNQEVAANLSREREELRHKKERRRIIGRY